MYKDIIAVIFTFEQDCVLIENMHDIPYLHTDAVGPEVTSVMTSAAIRVKQVFNTGPVGIQVLAGANQQALAIALATGMVLKCFLF